MMKTWAATCSDDNGVAKWSSKTASNKNGCCPTNWLYNHKHKLSLTNIHNALNLQMVLNLPSNKLVLLFDR